MNEIVIEARISMKQIRSIAKVAVEMLEDKNKQKENAVVGKQGYTLNEIEDLYGISTQTLARHARSGLLIASKPGKSYLVKKNDLLNYINNNINE